MIATQLDLFGGPPKPPLKIKVDDEPLPVDESGVDGVEAAALNEVLPIERQDGAMLVQEADEKDPWDIVIEERRQKEAEEADAVERANVEPVPTLSSLVSVMMPGKGSAFVVNNIALSGPASLLPEKPAAAEAIPAIIGQANPALVNEEAKADEVEATQALETEEEVLIENAAASEEETIETVADEIEEPVVLQETVDAVELASAELSSEPDEYNEPQEEEAQVMETDLASQPSNEESSVIDTAQVRVRLKQKKIVSAKSESSAEGLAPRGRKPIHEYSEEAEHLNIPPDEELFKRQYYSMRETAAMFKVNQSLLRFWENEFDILQPKKNKKGDRYFRPADVKNLQLIYHLLRVRKFTTEGAKEYLKNHNKALDSYELAQKLEKIKSFLHELKANL